MFKGYNAVHKCQPLRSGGGVSIYIQNFLEYYTREDLCYQNSTIESVFIEIDKDQIGKEKNVIIGVIYRPPNSDIYSFNNYISEILTKIKCERKYVSCLGDYNISLLNYDTHGPTQEFAICCTSIHCYHVSPSQHVSLLNRPRWFTTSSVTACYMMIMLLLVFYTLTYQTTFQFFISMAHLKRRFRLYI